MRRRAPAACAALAGFLATAAAAEAPGEAAQAPQPALTRAVGLPLGPPRPSFPVTEPLHRNAFPADILARMRAALVARGGLPAPGGAAAGSDG